MGVIYFSFSGAPIIATVCNELKDKSVQRLNKVLIRAFIILTCLYVSLAVLGYLSYAEDMPKLVVFRPGLDGDNSADLPMIVGRVLVGCYLTLATPMVINPTRKVIEQVISQEVPPPSKYRHYIVNLVICIMGATISILVPDVLVYFKILGGFFVTWFSFVLPTMFYYKIEDKNNLLFAVISIFAVLFTGIGIAVTLDIFIS
mmetsp:Transcript_2936/g.385  ORF Transcript_2936/g.385 Transcript_2936/m.385 type:complete len:202 (-) Transcript_2936:23-628(-)